MYMSMIKYSISQHMEGMCQNVVKKRIMLTARDEPEALILTVEDVVATEGETVVLLSTDSVVRSPAPPSTVEAVEAAALALACDVLNVNVASRVVSAEKLGSASLRENSCQILQKVRFCNENNDELENGA